MRASDRERRKDEFEEIEKIRHRDLAS